MQVNRLSYLLSAFQDPTAMLKSVKHQDDTDEFYKWYVSEVERIFKEVRIFAFDCFAYFVSVTFATGQCLTPVVLRRVLLLQ